MSDTKTKLLNSAERAARARGYDGFSYADLAEDVGIRKASIHHHYPTKAALAGALVDRYSADFEATCARIDAAHSDGGARLRGLINAYRDATDGGGSLCLCVSLSTSRESLPGEVLLQIAQFRARMTNWLAQAFALGHTDLSIARVQEPAAEAPAMLALLEGAQLAARAERDIARFDAALATTLGRLN